MFWGFAGLTNLSSLRLECVRTPHGAETLALSLTHLAHLTSLEATDWYDSDYDDVDEDYELWPDDEDASEEDDSHLLQYTRQYQREQTKRVWDHYTRSRLGGHILMPYLTTLTKLQSLELTSAWRLQEAGRWQLLPALTGLTRLVLSHDIDAPVARQCDKPYVWTRDHLAFILSLPRLTSLKFTKHHQLGVDALRLLAMAPCLTELQTNPVDIDEDLSRLPVAWKRLTLPHCTLDQLLRLPLSNVTCLATDEVDFSLTGPDASHASTRIQEAAELLAMRWSSRSACARQSEEYQKLRLHWELGPSQAPSAPTHSVLAALAPLGSARNPAASRLHVILEGESWEVGEQHMQLLNQHLPQLAMLTVTHAGPSFVAALAALADGALPQLRKLDLSDNITETYFKRKKSYRSFYSPSSVEGTEAGQQVCEGLLALLKARCDLGLPLRVFDRSCLTSTQHEHCRQELQQHMEARSAAGLPSAGVCLF